MYIIKTSRDSSVGVVTRLCAARPGYSGSNTGRSRRFPFIKQLLVLGITKPQMQREWNTFLAVKGTGPAADH